MVALTRRAATNRVKAYASYMVHIKYDENGISPHAYHNGRHSLDVEQAAVAIGIRAVANGKITHKSTTLLEIAPPFHDIEQGLGSGANEIESADIAVEQMEDTGAFEVWEIEAVNQMILSTITTFVDGVMKQSADAEGLDDEMVYLCRIMADADLATLGAPWETYWNRVEGLQLELLGEDPTAEARRTFLEGQLRLLQNHVFFTDEARELYPYQADHIGRLIAQLSII
jgi:predicted metal-dependent HD superfamily phosphohydrolase